MLRYDGLRRLGWALLSGMLWVLGKSLTLVAWPPLVGAEAALRGSTIAHLNALSVSDATWPAKR